MIASAVSNERATQLVRHTYQVIDELDRLSLAIERTETAERGYLLAPDPIRANTRRRNAALIAPSLNRLAELTKDNPRQRQLIAALRVKLSDQLATIEDMMAQAEKGDLASARAEFIQRVKVRQIDQIRAIESQIRDEENRLLDNRQAVESVRRGQFTLILAITGLLILLAGAAAFALVRRYTRDLSTARDRLHLLNTDLEGVVSERTADLRRANDEIQRFAYIVSHDLRSPLVNILGFTAELEETNKSLGSLLERAEKEAPQIITPDSRAAREDLPEAIGFIRASTQKMDRLINAILKLSREGRRTLTPELLPMEKIFDDIVASLDHRLTDAGATATVEIPVPDLVSDRVAIEQIFSNLIENAVKYLQPGRPGQVAVRGYKQGDRLIYEVEDNGRGIDPKDHQRVFDLFRRSGLQDQPGEGIGLAHVRALAYRLGGFIDLKSELGQGATFQVNLPATYTDEEVPN
jgi:signal transduction histidine kinase